MGQNVFKLCMIVISHEYYTCTLLSVTFDLYQGHGVSAKFNFAILKYTFVFVVTFIKLGMSIINGDLYLSLSLLVTFDLCQGHRGSK